MLASEELFPTQASLPPLPVPSLADTRERYLASLRPLLSPEDLAHTEELLNDFCRDGGGGAELQQMLEERAGTERNWVEEWWEQLAYLRTRTTMAVHINWFGVIPDWGRPMSNVHAAALMIHGVCSVRSMILGGKFPVEQMRGQPLDMHQFTRVFGMARVPQEGADVLHQVDDSRHVVVLRRGCILTVRVLDSRGNPLPLAALVALMASAIAIADAHALLEATDEPPVSVLTALGRDEWARERTRLLEDTTSAKSLAAVEAALFVVALDHACPATKEEAGQLCLGGSGRDRWYDKSFTVVIFDNGRGGLNAEHTPVDAMTIVSIFVKVLGLARKALASGHALPKITTSLPMGIAKPTKLEWTIDSDRAAAIEVASAAIGALAGDMEMRALHFGHFGKGFIKRAKLHPDFFIQAEMIRRDDSPRCDQAGPSRLTSRFHLAQMAIQLAYYSCHGKFGPTYETGHVRAFYHGRTDTVRTLSVESCAFVRAMIDASSDATARYAALRAACEAHGEQLQRVLTGQGIDRHLLGLYIASQMRGEAPAIFSDKAFKLSGGGGNFVLSTSNVGYTALFGGFAPMVTDGYGVCYSLLEGRINITTTAWRSCTSTSAQRMRSALHDALMGMMAVVVEARQQAKL